MSTNTTNYGWLLPDDGQIGWGSSLRTFISDVDDKLYNRVNLQSSTPGTAQTGHSNISGTAKSGSVDTGAITGAGLAAITRTGEQLRLLYDVSHYASFTVGSGGDLAVAPSGDLTLAPTGGDTSVTGTLGVSTALTVGTTLTVNGSGDSELTAGRLLVTKTTEQLRLRYNSGNYAAFAVDNSGNLQIDTSGGVISPASGDVLRSPSYTSGVLGWNIAGDGSAEFNNVRVRGELAAFVMKVSELSSTAGTFGVFYSAAALYEDVTTPSGTGSSYTLKAKNSDAGGMLFAVGDFCRMKSWTGSGISDAWFEVTARTNNTTYTTYTVTSRGSTGFSVTFRAGTGVSDYGPSGAGYVTLSADGTVGSSPNLTMATHAGAPWTTQTTRARLGNLNGSYGYATDVYGLGVGAYGVASNSWVTVDATNGVRIGNNTTTKLQAKTNGDLDLSGDLDVSGNLYAASRKITLNSSGFSTTAGTSDGNFYFMRHYNATPTEVANHQIFNATGSSTVRQVMQTLVPAGSYTASTLISALGKDGSGTPLVQQATLGLSGGPTSVTSAYLEALRNIAGGNVDSIRMTLAASSSAKTLEISTAGAVPGNAYVTINGTAQSTYPLQVNGDTNLTDNLTLPGQHRAKAYKSSAHSALTSGGVTAIDFNASEFNVGSMYSSGTVTVSQPGTYLLIGQIRWPNNTTGRRAVFLYVGGTGGTLVASQQQNNEGAADGTVTRQNCSTVKVLAASDTVTLAGFQNSGGNLTPDNGAGETFLCVCRLY